MLVPTVLTFLWFSVLGGNAIYRERRAYDRAQRAQFVDHIGDFYGLEVEEPLLREPAHPLRAALDRLRKKAAQSGCGISQVTEDAILADTGLPSPDNIAQADAIVEDEVQRLQAAQDGDTKSD